MPGSPPGLGVRQSSALSLAFKRLTLTYEFFNAKTQGKKGQPKKGGASSPLNLNISWTKNEPLWLKMN